MKQYRNRNRFSKRKLNNYKGRKFNKRNRGYHNSSQKINKEKYIYTVSENYKPASIYVETVLYRNFQINKRLRKNIFLKGYTHPTQIQNKAIPAILKEQDVLGLASTGSGKTGAFLIPLIEKIYRDQTQRCLIIVPTRELAKQIEDELKDLSKNLNIHSTLVIGGIKIYKQITKLKRRPQFVIGTPGRIKDLANRKVLKLFTFNNIVLDEVDRMLDMGFITDIQFLVSQLNKTRQTLFFSATMSPVIKNIAKKMLHQPITIQTEKEAPGINVEQNIVETTDANKLNSLIDILKKKEISKVLIFSRTKRGVDKLSKALRDKSFKVNSIHGDKTQSRRTKVLQDFKTNKISILVATDVAARGLDIPNVSHVINYDEPENFKDYIHRIGRTGRAGKTGCALTFVTR